MQSSKQPAAFSGWIIQAGGSSEGPFDFGPSASTPFPLGCDVVRRRLGVPGMLAKVNLVKLLIAWCIYSSGETQNQ